MIPNARLDHVAIAVRDIATSAPLFINAFGMDFVFAADNEPQGFRFAQFEFPGGGKIEFVAPLSPDGFVARFLERRGEGVHHVTVKTDDIVAALAHLEATGVPVTMVNITNDLWKEAFIHPSNANGVLVQVAQSRLSDAETARHHLQDHTGQSHGHLAFEDLGMDLQKEPPARR